MAARYLLFQALQGLASPTINLANVATGVAVGNADVACTATAHGTYKSADVGLDTGIVAVKLTSPPTDYYATGFANLALVNGAGFVDVYETYGEAEAAGPVPTPSGPGPWLLAVTVTSSGNPVAGAAVSASSGGQAYSATTNGAGVATLALPNGTYTLAAVAVGYASATASKVVTNANTTAAISLAVPTLPPSPVGTVTGYWTCYTEAGVVEPGAQVTMSLAQAPTGTGLALDKKPRTVAADGLGIAGFPGLIKGATYRVTRGQGPAFNVKIPLGAGGTGGTLALDNIIGQEV